MRRSLKASIYVISHIYHTRVFQVLEADGGSAAGGTLTVITDGEENTAPFSRAVIPILDEKSVFLKTYLLTEVAEASLIEATASIGGVSYYDSGNITTIDLLLAFYASTKATRSSPVMVGCS